MEHQLQDLIDRIKKDGFEQAESQAQETANAAKAEAEKILADAKAKAEQIIQTARKEADQLLASGKDALVQAARDLSITVEKDLKAKLDALLKDCVAEQYNAKALEEGIYIVLKNWAEHPQSASIQIAEKDLKALQASMKAKLAEFAKSGLELKLSPRVSGGFRLQEADGSSYYDFSSETVAQALSEYVSTSLSQIIQAKE